MKPYLAIDHVQLAMPKGMEGRAREFYCGVLGMTELEKPPELERYGGCWFVSGDVQIHLGVEADFRPARKAHPGLTCAEYDKMLAHLRAHMVVVREDDLPNQRRAYVDDPFGNRLELME
jgi:catechol 2,3-dioxygenase-like lactoylglutathione lyase family enzyme